MDGNPFVPYKYFIGILREPQEYSIGIPATGSVSWGGGEQLVGDYFIAKYKPQLLRMFKEKSSN